MPNWVTNELSVAGPRGAVEVLDNEVWSPEDAAGEYGAGFRFHIAVPAVPPGSKLCPSYPAGNAGTNAWGCRAVGAARPHRRDVVTSIEEWDKAHGAGFYLHALEDTAYERLANSEAGTPFTETIRHTMKGDEAPLLIRYGFETAYSPPERFASELARRYPHLYIRLLWEGDCASVHGITVHAPTKIEWRGDAQPVMPPTALLEALTPMRVRKRRQGAVALG